MKLGLVLGAGGVTGGAWLTGALHAIVEETGWDPGSADVVNGTSAGAIIGTIVAAGGVPPWFMVAHSAGEDFAGLDDRQGRPTAEADRSGGAAYSLHRGLPQLGPGSWRLALGALRNPARHPAGAVFAGWLPTGVVSPDPLRHIVRSAVPEGWGGHPQLWLMACDYATGRRVAFGRADAPPADLADAAAASCAIPGFYRPVEIGGRRYVDGGLWSTSNLDILRHAGLDLVICLNPTSSLHPTHAWDPGERIAALVRRQSGRRLGWEARRLREAGTRVMLVQPTGEDLATMGPNLMSRRNRNAVIAT